MSDVDENSTQMDFGFKTISIATTDEIDGCQKHGDSSIIADHVNKEIDFIRKRRISLEPNLQADDESVGDFSYEATENGIENELVAENTRLMEALAKNSKQYGNIQTMLQHKDELIELQKKELTLFESEKEALTREFEIAKKEKEQAVVRYAMLEKNIIDANTAKDISARKLRDFQKDVEQLTNRLKVVSGERDKAHKEIREYIRENETVKYDLQTCETKLKWSHVKLKQEMGRKAELEKKLNELNQQFNQLNEQRQQQVDSDKKSEREQDAQLIMLKHLLDEKERSLTQIQKSMNELRTEFTELFEKSTNLRQDFETEKHTNVELQAKLADMESQLKECNVEQHEFRSKLLDSQSTSKTQMTEIENLVATVNKLKYVEDYYRQQSDEMTRLRSKQDEHMKLLKDLTEKCVLVENKLILANSKSSSLMLDNERIKKEFKCKLKMVQELEDDLVKVKLKHNEEIKLFNKILADEKNHTETLQSKLDNLAGDLDATKNKHSQIVKELNRELAMLRKHSTTTKSSVDIDDENQRVDIDGEVSVENGVELTAQQTTTNGIGTGGEQEPSKKVLIDRIVKLQRLLAKQTEKIEFLENHCVALFNELRAKSL